MFNLFYLLFTFTSEIPHWVWAKHNWKLQIKGDMMETKVPLRCSFKCAKKATSWVTSRAIGIRNPHREARAKQWQLAKIITKQKPCDIIKIPQSEALGPELLLANSKECNSLTWRECAKGKICIRMWLFWMLNSKSLSNIWSAHKCHIMV